MSIYQQAIADIEARIERLQSARSVLIEISRTTDDRVVRQIAAFGRKPLAGTAKIVMDAIQSGANTVDLRVGHHRRTPQRRQEGRQPSATGETPCESQKTT